MVKTFLLPSNPIQTFILVPFIILLHTTNVGASEQSLLHQCSNTTDYTSGSQYQTNLQLLLKSLVSNGSRDGYLSTSVGMSPDIVYGLAQCRGDLPTEDCYSCLSTAQDNITQSCPTGMNATVRYDRCLLRYSDSRFLPTETDTANWSFHNAIIKDIYVVEFSKQLEVLLKKLKDTAKTKPNRYSSGDINFAPFKTIFGMVQCTRDLSTTECDMCLNHKLTWIPNCCNKSSGAKIFGPNCYLQYDIDPFIEESSQSPPPPQSLPPSQTTATKENGTGGGKVTNIAVIILPIFGLILVLSILAFFITKRIQKSRKEKYELISESALQFDLDTLRMATNEFSIANKLGEGGFGAVYKGELPDGQNIAVKRLSINSGQGLLEFRNEVEFLHKLQHRNLVRLLGYCVDEEEKLLIYEFVPNTSLDKYIFDSTKKSALDWITRYKIIGGIVRGLLYLHEDSRLRIIHRDLKAGNILLDEEMNAKIADFGTSKLFGLDQTRGETSIIAGTYGYMAPEYASHGFFSVKSDVFSFGILLLEIISGRKASSFHPSAVSRDLPCYAWKLWKEDRYMELMDPALMESYSAAEVVRCIHIGLLCVQDNLEDRPTMSSVQTMLNSYSVTLKTPSSPALLRMKTGTSSTADAVQPSGNDVLGLFTLTGR